MDKIVYSTKEPKKQRKSEHDRFLEFFEKKYPNKYAKMIFNYNFLLKMKKLYNTLHCVYCNRFVKIYQFSFRRSRKGDVATADHFLPKSLHPDLEFQESNLRVCCTRCNSRKGQELWEEKFPYKSLNV